MALETINKIKTAAIIAAVLVAGMILGVVGKFAWEVFGPGSDERVLVEIDKTVIVKEIKKVNKLETVTMVLQRDITITLDLGDFEIFGQKLLENRRTQEIAVTGSVTAGIDLGELTEDDINLTDDKNKLEITLPEPEILSVNIMEDKTDLIDDDLTLLFKLSNLGSDKKRETNEYLLQQAIKQSKTALVDGACGDNILKRANENIEESIIQGPFGTLIFDEITVKTTEAQKCEYIEIGEEEEE